MRGKYRIIIENRKMKYDFEIKRNLTIIKGDSATGKTTLVDMIAEFYENGQDSGINLQCNKLCAVLQGKDWKLRLGNIDLKQTYNEMYQIYGDVNPNTIVCPKTVITEDSGAGFQYAGRTKADYYRTIRKSRSILWSRQRETGPAVVVKWRIFSLSE